jgi:hypothetical protein
MGDHRFHAVGSSRAAGARSILPMHGSASRGSASVPRFRNAQQSAQASAGEIALMPSVCRLQEQKPVCDNRSDGLGDCWRARPGSPTSASRNGAIVSRTPRSINSGGGDLRGHRNAGNSPLPKTGRPRSEASANPAGSRTEEFARARRRSAASCLGYDRVVRLLERADTNREVTFANGARWRMALLLEGVLRSGHRRECGGIVGRGVGVGRRTVMGSLPCGQ